MKLKLSTPEKEFIIKNGPNQPDKSVLTRTSTTGSHIPDIVPHSLFTMPMVPKAMHGYHIHHQRMPCAMYIFCSVHHAALRGQHLRPNQGIAFTLVGFRSWKKQHGSVLQHEACTSHRNSIVAQVMHSVITANS